jgi:patatin-like phospholipase/acyl hydrolase
MPAAITDPSTAASKPCHILSLDGGGAKGFYTLGVLKQLEAVTGPLHEQFDLIFGTSTGAIIAALLALGRPVAEIHELYHKHVPTVMRSRRRRSKSAALAMLAESVFKDAKFTDVKTGIGIVATRWAFEKPMIFKASVGQAHGRHATFQPGFGCTLAEAVRGSCSAYPFFDKTVVNTTDGPVIVIDGGYCANNPTLYGIADGVKAFGRRPEDLRVVSIGVGVYPEPKRLKTRFLKHVVSVELLQKTLNVNTTSMEQLRAILFKDVPTVRINDTFESPEMATDLFESNMTKLTLLFQRGGESFARHENDIRALLAIAKEIR